MSRVPTRGQVLRVNENNGLPVGIQSLLTGGESG
jgi:hypothetical protein